MNMKIVSITRGLGICCSEETSLIPKPNAFIAKDLELSQRQKQGQKKLIEFMLGGKNDF
ncbi:MAG: hypothetical protein FWB90_00050 [Fibromonadales bacterium]|nr:hypothetical protein [Fibromonadales bacterium]